MTARILRARLVAVVGEYEAQELLEAPNGSLGGRSPIDLLDERNFAPVETLIRDLELKAATRRDFIHAHHHDFDEIDELVADAEIDLKPRSLRQADRVLQILDDIAVESLRSKHYEERSAE
jgi:hypothetical protein